MVAWNFINKELVLRAMPSEEMIFSCLKRLNWRKTYQHNTVRIKKCLQKFKPNDSDASGVNMLLMTPDTTKKGTKVKAASQKATYIHTYIHNWPFPPFSQDYGLVSHTAHVVCVNFIHEWWDLQFNVDSE